MAGISTSIQLADRMSPVLQSIISAMKMMVSSFSAAQAAAQQVYNASDAVAQ